MSYDPLLARAADRARAFISSLPGRRVNAANPDPLTGDSSRLGEAADPLAVLDDLSLIVEEGGVATPGPRYFGFVTGGSYPVAVAADWLVSAWDQNAAFHSLSPAAAAIEEITSAWTLELIGLPDTASVGFVTGGPAPTRHAWPPRATLSCHARAGMWSATG